MTTRAALLRRWLAKVESFPADPSACWVWGGEVRRRGYGRMRVGGRRVPAHRVALELAGRPVPDGLVTDHLCRNPVCVRPSHLEAVTHTENLRRGVRVQKTHCPQGHPLIDGNLRRRMGARAHHRECLTCHRGGFARRGVRHE